MSQLVRNTLGMQRLTRDRTMRRSLTKTPGLNVNGTARPYDNAARCGNRSGSFKTLTIHR